MILSLHTLTLEAPLNQSGQCLVLAELILPRNGIARKAALKDVRLTTHSTTSASSGQTGSLRVAKASFVRKPFYEKALLKEKVDGRFGLKVSVTRPLKHPELNQFLRRLLATGIESSADLISPLALSLSNLVDDLVDETADQLADRILDDESFIATGGLDFDSETLTSGKITVPLKLTETLRKSDLPPGPKSRDKRKTAAKFYKKGSQIGQISFELLA